MEVRAKWAMLVVALAVAGGSAWIANRVYHPDGGVQVADGGSANWSLMGAGKGGETASAAREGGTMRTPQQTRDRLFKDGSFQGTVPDGDWVLDDKGRLKPHIALRRRFEYYLLGQGEVSVAEIRALVEDEVRRDKGEDVARQVMALWDKYWELRTYPFRNAVNVGDRSTWQPSFEEQKAVRRQILGPAWAEAFYADEEAYFQNFMGQVEGKVAVQPDANGPVPQLAPGKDAAAVFEERRKLYGEDAAKRLAQADDEWAAWERRFNAAKAEWARLSGSAELSAPQRKAEMDRYVEQNFKSEEERRRVRALLDLP